MSPTLLPTDQNGALAAQEAPLPPGSPLQPPAPQRPAMGPPQDPMQQIMGMLGQPQPQPPAAPPPLGNQEPPVPGQPQTPAIPGVAGLEGAGSDPLGIQQQKLQQHMAELKQQKEQVQKQIKDLMNPDAINNQLPGGGKQKPSDFLRDAMYNFAQLNLRNPVYGSLKGQEYKPIQQQRYEQALSQHNAQLQNLTLMDKSLNEQMQSDQYMANQARQEQQERDRVSQQKNVLDLAVQKQSDLVKQNAIKNNVANILAKSRVGLMSAQQAKTELQTEILDQNGGNTADFLHTYVRQHQDDPTFLEDYARIKKTIEPTKSPTGTTVFVPNQDGGYNVMRVDQGSSIPAGARTLASISGDSTFPMTTKTMIANAPSVIELTDRAEALLDKNQQLLGPLKSRWADFVSGKIGVPGEGYTRISTVAGLLQTKLMQMHVGSRGSTQMLEKFKSMLDQSVQSPENLRAALAEIRLYAQHVASETPPNAPEKLTSKPASVAPPVPAASPNQVPKVGDTHNGKKVAKVEILP